MTAVPPDLADSDADADPLDFTYLDRLDVRACGQGRLFLGEAVRVPRAAPLLLFVHGAYHGAWCFASYLRYFDAAGIPSAALDVRGHGGLAQDDGFHRQGVRDMAADVAAACALFPGSVIPVGHSAGALFAAVAAETTPVAGLGLLTPSPPAQLPSLRALPLMPEGGPLPPPDLATVRRRYLAGLDGCDLSGVMARLCPESPVMMNDRYGLRISVHSQRLRVPACCIAAGRDFPLTHPPGQDRETARFFGAEFTELPDAPHCFMLSPQWHRSAGILLDWYRRHFGGW